jgi:hypothetical protein
MSTNFTGGCACGAIRYEVSAEPIVMFNCHCRDCQKTTGGPYTGHVRPSQRFQDYERNANVLQNGQRDGRR